MSVQRKMARKRPGAAWRVKCRQAAHLMAALAVCVGTIGFAPVHSPNGVREKVATDDAASHSRWAGELSASLLLMAYGSSGVRAAAPAPEDGGPYEYLRPLGTMAQPLDGEGLTFDSWTGLITGSIVDTSWLTPAWLLANADTIQTVRASGGDYTPAQAQDAVDAAATRNDLTVYVVDPGLELAAHDWASKGTTYALSNWTLFVSRDWWDGTWTPTGRRTLRVSGVGSELAHTFYVQSRLTAPRAAVKPSVGEWRQHKYGYVGCEFRRNLDPTQTGTGAESNFAIVDHDSNAIDPDNDLIARGLILHWCWINGGDPTPTGHQCQLGLRSLGGLSMHHTLITGIARAGQETKAFVPSRNGLWYDIVSCVMEAESITILVGGNTAFQPERVAGDIWMDNVGMVKRQEWNPSSPTHQTGWTMNKQALELKDGQRITMQGVDILNSWRGAQTGAGLTVQNVAQTVAGANITRDITARHFRIRNCNTPLSLSHPSGDEALQPDSMSDIDLQNILALRGPAERLNLSASVNAVTFTTGFIVKNPTPRVNLIGPFTFKWITLAVPASDTLTSAFFRPLTQHNDAARAEDVDFTMTDCIFPHRASVTAGFITENSSEAFNRTTQRLGANAFTQWELGGRGSATIARNVFGRLGGTDAARRNTFETPFPEQFNPPELWPASLAEFGFVNATEDPMDGNYRLANDSPLKGLAAGGRDPGCDHDLIEAAVGDILDSVPDFITLAFPEAP